MKCKYFEKMFKIRHQQVMEDRFLKKHMSNDKVIELEKVLSYTLKKYGCKNNSLQNLLKDNNFIKEDESVKYGTCFPEVKFIGVDDTQITDSKIQGFPVLEIKNIGILEDTYYYYPICRQNFKELKCEEIVSSKKINSEDNVYQIMDTNNQFIKVVKLNYRGVLKNNIKATFNVDENNFENDPTLIRAFSGGYVDLASILDYLLSKYGCKNNSLQECLNGNYQMCGWGKLSYNYTPAFGNISISPKNAIIKDAPVFYIRKYWTSKVGTMCYYCYRVFLYPIHDKVEDLIDVNFKGNFNVNKEENYISIYVRH
ncbi:MULTISPECIES: hypothetical protein [Clostridium]|uniref:hypothetical protein n=1 Tax=Clostridium TaxID=1485 RepID=UPI00090942B3|nr:MULTISPECIES: hypothetical protein [Clostridium]APF25241.1 hypothetical protein NPD7_3816 [Clostridium sporogenes]MBD5639577.1 hypothetical protein [Clostridium botulinum]MBO0526674.1 hypothetical protein [Clostridium botulinum]MBO0526984.1 hypothetical protein [Clostridium botulinum]MBO0532503.1 hypothetical protein [Clostridium botulinum]